MHPLDRLYLDRAYELAARGLGNTSPNPPVGAVLVRDGVVVGEGYHHRAGEPHAEINALRQADELARGAALYVSLEPCNHIGRTPPCSRAIAAARVARVVVGTRDPNPKADGAGIAYLREHGIAVDVADEPRARSLIEPFARAIALDRPYMVLKMAVSLDGYVAERPGLRTTLSGPKARSRVREMRTMFDAVMVGAGTARIDDPLLTVRPPHHRLRPYHRVVACECGELPASLHLFEPQERYAPTIVLAPGGSREQFESLAGRAELRFIGGDDAQSLDLGAAMRELRSCGVESVICEGGPTLGAALLAARCVDRLVWLLAPRFLRGPRSVPALGDGPLAGVALHYDVCEALGEDLMIEASVANV